MSRSRFLGVTKFACLKVWPYCIISFALPPFSAGQDTNILTEQIDKDVTRIHKLELENARLLSELEDVRVNGVKESSARILELEKANKKHEMSARQGPTSIENPLD